MMIALRTPQSPRTPPLPAPRSLCKASEADVRKASRHTDLLKVHALAKKHGESFIARTMAGQGGAERAADGARALLYARRQREIRPARGKDEVTELRNLLCIASMCGRRALALGYARALVDLPGCARDQRCRCTTAGRIVALIRRSNESSWAEADAFFESARLREACGYASSWQMPTPPSGYDAALTARPFWEPDGFAIGRYVAAHRAELLRELRPFARRRRTLWSTDQEGVAYELVEGRGSWRQCTLYSARAGWNGTVCSQLPTTCRLLRGFAASRDGRRELGDKIKAFELGAHASLMPHFGTTNRRLFMHFGVTVPSAGGGTYLRVADVTRRWGAPGERMLFDDSFEHGVLNEGAAPRVVLGIELRHPDLPAP